MCLSKPARGRFQEYIAAIKTEPQKTKASHEPLLARFYIEDPVESIAPRRGFG